MFKYLYCFTKVYFTLNDFEAYPGISFPERFKALSYFIAKVIHITITALRPHSTSLLQDGHVIYFFFVRKKYWI